MSALKQFVARNFFSLLYLMLAGSFLMLVAELVWTKHWDGIQLVGLLASGAGAVLALLAWAMGRKARMVLAALFAVLSITGIVGTVEHNEARGGEEASAPVIVAAAAGDFAPASAVQLQESDDDATSEAAGDHDDDARERNGNSEGDSEGDGEGEAVPPLAPLSLAGVSLMAAVILIADDNRSALVR